MNININYKIYGQIDSRKVGLDEKEDLFQPEPVENIEKVEQLNSRKSNISQKNDMFKHERIKDKINIKSIFKLKCHNIYQDYFQT